MTKCNFCLMDETVGNLKLDKNYECKYCRAHKEMEKDYQFNKTPLEKLFEIAEKIKKENISKNYDCICGVSGGRDSSYSLYVTKKILGLRPLAVHFDNGFNSEISVSNIHSICSSLNIDLETKVADWETFKNVTRSFFFAGVPDVDITTDIGIFKTMYEIAYREKINYVFNGHSFRTEGLDPLEWTYMDGLYIKSIFKKFGKGNLKKFDNFTILDLLKYKFLRNIKTILPLNYVEYDNKKVIEILQKEFDWQFYGSHHHESTFTKFCVSYYLPKKFNIDRRKTDLSAMIRSKKISLDRAKQEIKNPIIIDNQENLINFVLNKLEITRNEFDEILKKKNKNFKNFLTYYNFIKYFKIIIFILIKLKLIPKILYLKYYS